MFLFPKDVNLFDDAFKCHLVPYYTFLYFEDTGNTIHIALILIVFMFPKDFHLFDDISKRHLTISFYGFLYWQDAQ